MPRHEVTHFAPTLFAATLALAACDRGPPPTPTAPAIAPAHAQYVNREYALAVSYPATLGSSHRATAAPMDAGRWKLDAGTRSHGRTLLALTLPGSNRVTSATLRIGASRDPRALHACLRPPAGARTDDRPVRIGGVDFTRFALAEGAMSHYLSARAYRAVHDGTCYAIDLRVSGTRPEVYDPPATPPFSQQVAMQQLLALLTGIRFLD